MGRPRTELGTGVARRRRRHARGQRHRADRHERALVTAGHHTGGEGALRRRRGNTGDRRRHAEAARRDAPRHRLHLRRSRSRDRAPGDRRRRAHLQHPPERQGARLRDRRRGRRPLHRRRRTRSGAAQAASRRDGGRLLRLRASAVGQRQQRRGRRAGCGLHLRPQHSDERGPAQGRSRGHHHRRCRARARARRRPLHDLPPSSATPSTGSRDRFGGSAVRRRPRRTLCSCPFDPS